MLVVLAFVAKDHARNGFCGKGPCGKWLLWQRIMREKHEEESFFPFPSCFKRPASRTGSREDTSRRREERNEPHWREQKLSTVLRSSGRWLGQIYWLIDFWVTVNARSTAKLVSRQHAIHPVRVKNNWYNHLIHCFWPSPCSQAQKIEDFSSWEHRSKKQQQQNQQQQKNRLERTLISISQYEACVNWSSFFLLSWGFTSTETVWFIRAWGSGGLG